MLYVCWAALLESIEISVSMGGEKDENRDTGLRTRGLELRVNGSLDGLELIISLCSLLPFVRCLRGTREGWLLS